MVILEVPYFDGCKNSSLDFVNQKYRPNQLFEQANFVNNIKIGYAELKLKEGTQMFWEDLEYIHFINYESPIAT